MKTQSFYRRLIWLSFVFVLMACGGAASLTQTDSETDAESTTGTLNREDTISSTEGDGWLDGSPADPESSTTSSDSEEKSVPASSGAIDRDTEVDGRLASEDEGWLDGSPSDAASLSAA